MRKWIFLKKEIRRMPLQSGGRIFKRRKILSRPAAGNLISTNWGGGVLEVIAPDGSLVCTIRLPFDKPSNIHFKGPDSILLLVSEHDQNGLWQFDYGSPGQRQYGWRESEK